MIFSSLIFIWLMQIWLVRGGCREKRNQNARLSLNVS